MCAEGAIAKRKSTVRTSVEMGIYFELSFIMIAVLRCKLINFE